MLTYVVAPLPKDQWQGAPIHVRIWDRVWVQCILWSESSESIMSEILLEIVILSLLIVLNGVFAMSELAMMSARKPRLQEHANQGSAGARTALELANSPNQFLSTVQVGITLIGVLAGAFGGATIASVLSDSFAQVDLLAPYSEALSFGLVVLTITYFSLVIGELVPKRLALQNPERIAALVAWPMQALARLTFPIVRLLSASTNLVVRALGIHSPDEPPVTEEEIRIMIQQGTEAGVFEEAEQNMVESVFRLDDRHVGALMTPHTEVVWLDVSDSADEIRAKIAECPYSTLPVCRDDLNNLLGVARAKDLLAAVIMGGALDLEAHLRPPRFVPENATASRVVEMFKRGEEHVVLVIDEHGGIQGIVTEHDILEAIVGDIPSVGELDEPTIVRRADGSYLLDGLMHIEDLVRLLGLHELPGADRGSYHTLGGFIMSLTGEIPAEGECFQWAGYRFEVVDMDGLRVDKLLVAPDPHAGTGPCESEDDSPGGI
jgi:putative hemolysin